jgi:hypothetical protein
MSSLEFEIGKSVLQVFATLAGKYIEKAREFREQDIRACENYLEAARISINGLEEEYDQILVQAKNCDLSRAEQIRALKIRIDAYLTVDILRPKLQDAVVGLALCREALRKNAEGFLLWLWPPLKEKRREAIAKFNALLKDLEQYLKELDEEGLKYLKAGTGVGVMTLREIQDYLDSRPAGNIDPYGLARRVSQFQRDPSKDHLMNYTKRIRETIHALRSAFK